MENPVKEIEGVVRNLTQSSPSVQQATLEKYFTPDAYFVHPFCRSGCFDNSRQIIGYIYRWYKIMSPVIELEVLSVAFDEPNLILYSTIRQTFRIWAIPFHEATVELSPRLRLRYNEQSRKYYIASQNDLYQVDQFCRFLLVGELQAAILYLFHFIATIFCILGCWFLYPITILEERWARANKQSPQNQPTIFQLAGEVPKLLQNTAEKRE